MTRGAADELTRGAAALPEEEGDALKRGARFYRPALPLSRVGKISARAREYIAICIFTCIFT